MIIYLDDSIINKIEENCLSNDEIEGLHAVCSSDRHSRHMVIGGRNVLERLIGCRDLSSYGKAAYISVLNSLSERLPLFDMVNVVARVYSGTPLSSVNEKNVIDIELSSFESSKFGLGVKVYFEDESDGGVYRAILNRVKKDKGLQRLVLHFESRHGGGDRTGKCLERSLQSGEVSICLVDSDIVRPGGRPKDTAMKVVRIAKEHRHETGVHVINAHEVENLIPPEIYRACGSEEDLKEIMNNLESISKRIDDVYLYFDYKKGIKRCSVARCQYMKSYWGEVEICSECGNNGDICYIIGPYKSIKKVMAWVEEKKLMPSTSVGAIYQAWEKIFEFIFMWCVAVPENRL